MKTTIHITEEIIQRSKYCNSNGLAELTMVGQNCAIGLAIFDLFGNKSWVADNTIEIHPKGFQLRTSPNDLIIIPLPLRAQMFVASFDVCTPEQRDNLNPISFDIELPDEVVNLIGIEEITKILTTSNTLSLAD